MLYINFLLSVCLQKKFCNFYMHFICYNHDNRVSVKILPENVLYNMHIW